MELKCQHVSASDAYDELFEVIFEVERDQEDGPYLLIQRAFLEEEDEDDPVLCYVETHDENLCGHYRTLEAKLTRNRFALRFPPPVAQTVEVEFLVSDRQFRRIKRILGIILQRNFKNEEKKTAE